MRKVYVKRLFSVLMILVLLAGVVTFPSAAQEAAYTELQQREDVTLKRLAELPGSEAVELLEEAGFSFNRLFFTNDEFLAETVEKILDTLSQGYVPMCTYDYSIKNAENVNINVCARNLQVFLLRRDPEMAQYYMWQESDRAVTQPFSARELCQLSEAECLQVMREYGLQLPETSLDPAVEEKMALLRVKEALQKCSEGIFDQYNFGDFTNVDISFSVQYLATKYDPEVAALYKEYLQSFQTTEDTDTSMAIPGLTRDASGLQDSTAVGSWGESYGKYNCYGYAIGTNQWMTPGSYSGSSYNVFSVSSVKDAVIDDFNTRGYWARATTTKPSTLTYWEKAICVRVGDGDYHFMKAGSLSSWGHKPGTSVPLVWNYSSPGAKYWTDEGIFSDGYYPGTHTYNSTIYYIIYWAKGGPGPDINSLDPITE